MTKPFHIKGPLTSRVGQEVSFKAPDDVARAGGAGRSGIVEKEVWADPSINSQPVRAPVSAADCGDYSFCSQLILWTDGTRSIRLGYYRRRAGEDEWHWGSQTTVEGEPVEIRALLEKTLSQADWF